MRDLRVINGGKKTSVLDNQKKIMVFLRAIIILLIILLVLFVAAKFLSDEKHVNSEDRTPTAIDYIYEVDSDTVIDMREWKDELVVLTDSYVAYVSRSGTLVARNAHKYSSPAMEISGDKILLYDIGSTSYRMENNKGIVFFTNTERPIIDASFAANGTYVFAEKGESAVCSVDLYNKKNEKTASWNCDEYITSVSMSRDGRSIAYSGVSGHDAVLSSEIYFVSVRDGSICAQIPFDCPVYEINHIKKDQVSVFGPGVFATADPAGRTDLASNPAVTENKYCFDPSGGTTALLLAKYGNENICSLQVFNTNGKIRYERTINGNVNSLSCSGRYTAVAKDKSVEIFNSSGKPSGAITLSDSAHRVEIGGSFLYLLTSRGISIHSVNANTELQIPHRIEAPSEQENVLAATSPVERPPAAVTERIDSPFMTQTTTGPGVG